MGTSGAGKGQFYRYGGGVRGGMGGKRQSAGSGRIGGDWSGLFEDLGNTHTHNVHTQHTEQTHIDFILLIEHTHIRFVVN